MLNETGLAAILQFGALGLLGYFMYRFDQSFKSQTEFQQQMTVRMMEIVGENTAAHRQATEKSEAVCKAIDENRVMEKEEHKALMIEHKMLIEDHSRITQKLTT